MILLCVMHAWYIMILHKIHVCMHGMAMDVRRHAWMKGQHGIHDMKGS